MRADEAQVILPRVFSKFNLNMLWRKRNNQQDISNDTTSTINPGKNVNTGEKQPVDSSPPFQSPSTPLTEIVTVIDPENPQNLVKSDTDMQHFQLLKWAACAFWSWDVIHDTCVICRNTMMSPCKLKLE